MSKTVPDILNELTPFFREILEDDALVLTASLTADDIEAWDSLTNIQLVVATEKHFKIRFTSEEIHGFNNLGEMCQGIIDKIGS